MYRTIKAAAISLKPKGWDKDHNADKLERFFRKAAKTKADLLLATEGVLDGYVVSEVIADPSRTAEMLELAEPIDGPYVKRFQRLARSLKTCLAFGFAERIGRQVYNAAIFIDHRGRLCGKYHKTQFAEGTHPSWNFNRMGRHLRAFDTPFGRAGFLICNDRWNANIARAIVLDGAQYLMICSFGTRTKNQNVAVLARGRENGVPVVEANVGVNMIVSKGEVVAYQWGVDRITTAMIDIPAPPSQRIARQAESQYIAWQKREMPRRYRQTNKSFKEGQAPRMQTDDTGRLVSRPASRRAKSRTS